MGAHSLDQTGICMNDDVAPPVVGSRRAPPETEIQTATERNVGVGREKARLRAVSGIDQPADGPRQPRGATVAPSPPTRTIPLAGVHGRGSVPRQLAVLRRSELSRAPQEVVNVATNVAIPATRTDTHRTR